nr:unnamed protein product [Callosobruchus analis]
MKIKNWEPTKNDRLCSKHFEDKWFYRTDLNVRTRLLNEAIPTIFSDLKKGIRQNLLIFIFLYCDTFLIA